MYMFIYTHTHTHTHRIPPGARFGAGAIVKRNGGCHPIASEIEECAAGSWQQCMLLFLFFVY